jgi:hypothetical protein
MTTMNTSDPEKQDIELHSKVLDAKVNTDTTYSQALSRLLALGLSVDEAQELLKD